MSIIAAPGRAGPRGWTHQRELSMPGLVAAQPESGRPIRSLVAAHGHLYLGYGDADQNTGPIMLVSYDLATGQPHEHVLIDTEAVGPMAVSPSGELVVVWLDPSGDFWGEHDITAGTPGQWRHESIGHYTHMDSVAFTDDGSWWAGGTKSDDGSTSRWGVWRRAPSGEWSNSYLSEELEKGPGGSVHLYGDGHRVLTTRPVAWDGNGWVPAEPVPYRREPLTLHGTTLDVNDAQSLASSHGHPVCELPTMSPEGSSATSRTIVDGTLYTGHTDGTVHAWTL